MTARRVLPEKRRRCAPEGAGAGGGGGRAAQLPAPGPRPRRRDEWTPANLGKDTRICTSFTLKKEAEKADTGAGEASPFAQERDRCSENSGPNFSCFQPGDGGVFWGVGVLETNEDKSALEVLPTGH